jgi:hypothetical protein
MKLKPLLCLLFLVGSPAVADDLLYLKCKGDLTSKVTNINTSEVLQENKGRHRKTYIIDRGRRKVMAKGGQWINAEIIEGLLTGSGTFGQGFSKSKETIRINIDPVDKYSYMQHIRQRNISMEIDALGTCEEIDASMLEEAFPSGSGGIPLRDQSLNMQRVSHATNA